MAEDKNVDDILVRLDEIEKLQAELRHLVPRVTSSSFGHQDPPRDSRASTRFPSLFTFPVISSLAPTPRNEGVQRSAARLNLNGKSLSGDRRRSAVSPRDAGGSSPGGTRGTSAFRNLLRSGNGPRARNSSASAADSRAPSGSGVASRPAEAPRGAIKKGSQGEAAARDKIRSATYGRSNVRLSGNENVNSMCSFVQTLNIHGTEATRSRGACLRNRPCKRNDTLLERIMDKLNYCFVNDKRVTVPYHHLGNKTPRRVQMLHSFKIEETETPHKSAAKMSVN